jgi:hypothetical protein
MARWLSRLGHSNCEHVRHNWSYVGDMKSVTKAVPADNIGIFWRALNFHTRAGAKTGLAVCLTDLNIKTVYYNWYIFRVDNKKLCSLLLKMSMLTQSNKFNSALWQGINSFDLEFEIIFNFRVHNSWIYNIKQISKISALKSNVVKVKAILKFEHLQKGLLSLLIWWVITLIFFIEKNLISFQSQNYDELN